MSDNYSPFDKIVNPNIPNVTKPVMSGGIFKSDTNPDIGILMIGDSLAQAGYDLRSTYQAEATILGMNVTLYDAATGGLKLQNFWNPVDDTKGASYTSLIENNANKDDVQVAFFSDFANSQNDIIQADYTAEEYETALGSMVDELFVTCANLERVFLYIPGRNSTNNTANMNTACEALRQAFINVVAAKENVYFASPHHDLDMADQYHPTTAAYKFKAKRDMSRVAYFYGLGSNPLRPAAGLIVSSAEVDSLGILLNLTHDSGSDITVDGDGLDGFLIDSDQTPIIQIDRVDGNTARLNTGAPWSNTPVIQTIEGSLYGLGQTDVDMIRENGDLLLPILPAEVTATNSYKDNDAILQLTDLAFYVKAGEFTKDYTSGVVTNKIRSANGKSFSSFGANAADMTYDASAFDGAGGLTGTTTNSGFGSDQDGLVMTSGGLLGLSCQVVDATATKYLMYLGSSTGGFGNAGLYIQSGILRYARNQASGIVDVLSGITNNTRLAIILDYQSATVLNIYVNNTTSPAATFDPNNDAVAATAVRMWINTINTVAGLSSTVNLFNSWFGKSNPHNPSNDPSLANLMARLKTNANIT